MGDAIALRRDWRVASLAGPWSGAADWWTGAVVAVSEVLVSRSDDPRAACRALGRERAEAGVFLDEARADIRLATELASLRPVRAGAAVDAVTVGWIDRTLDAFGLPCADPLTDLVPVSYLAMRLKQLRAEAALTGADPRAEHTLVVVKAASVPDPLEREANMVAVSAAMHSAFRGDQTLARLGPSCAAALTQRSMVRLRESLAVLASEISIAMSDGRLPPTRTWLEPLPADARGLGVLVAELS